MNCILRSPDATRALLRFNYDAIQRMPYLSALEVRSRRGAIQIHVYLYLYLEVAQPVHCRLTVFCCGYITLRYDLDLWPCDLDL